MIVRALPVAATMFLGVTAFLGLTAVGSAQMMGPGMGFPGAGGAMPGFGTAPAPPPPQQQEPPCFREFAPMKAEAEKRAMALKAAMEKKVPREEACNFVKSFSASEAKLVKYVTANAQTCGIPAQAVVQMKTNHDRTLKAQTQICSQNAGA